MTETKITGDLPNLHVEIVRRELTDEPGETVSIHMTATPSFEAVSGMLTRSLLPMLMMANPMIAWAHLMQTAWSPWLTLPGVHKGHVDNGRAGGARRLTDGSGKA